MQVRPMSMNTAGGVSGPMRVPLSMIAVKTSPNARKKDNRRARLEAARLKDEDDYAAMEFEHPEDVRTSACTSQISSQAQVEEEEVPHWTKVLSDIKESDERKDEKIIVMEDIWTEEEIYEEQWPRLVQSCEVELPALVRPSARARRLSINIYEHEHEPSHNSNIDMYGDDTGDDKHVHVGVVGVRNLVQSQIPTSTEGGGVAALTDSVLNLPETDDNRRRGVLGLGDSEIGGFGAHERSQIDPEDGRFGNHDHDDSHFTLTNTEPRLCHEDAEEEAKEAAATDEPRPRSQEKEEEQEKSQEDFKVLKFPGLLTASDSTSKRDKSKGVTDGRTIEEILQSLRNTFRGEGKQETHFDDTPAIAVSSEVSAPATDEAAGLPEVHDQHEQREESVPKHGKGVEMVKQEAMDEMRKAVQDLKEEFGASCVDDAIEGIAGRQNSEPEPEEPRKLGIEADGESSRGIWITPMASHTGCDIETPPGLSEIPMMPMSGVKQRRIRFDDSWSENSGIANPIEKLSRPLSIMTVKAETKPLMSVSTPEWQEIEITVDSGAYDTVMPVDMCGHISICSTPESRGGLTYEVANGECLPNVGERRCFMMTENSHTMKRITFQCADVHKPLLSISRIADLGYDCNLGKDGGQLRDLVTSDTIPVHRRGNLYVIRAWVRADDQSFGRQG